MIKSFLNFIGNSTANETDFSRAKDPVIFPDEIKSAEITIEKVKKLQEDFNNYLKKIGRGNKTEEQ